MNKKQPHRNASLFKSRHWVLHQATEQELLEYLNDLLLVQQEQQNELMTLVQDIVEDRLVMQEEMEHAAMDEWLVDDPPPRTSWFALGLAGLAGYLVGRRRD